MLYGIVLGWYRKKMLTLHPEDARIYLMPLFTLVTIIVSFGDSDNTMFLFLKEGALLTAVVLLSSSRLTAGNPPRALPRERGVFDGLVEAAPPRTEHVEVKRPGAFEVGGGQQ